MGRDVSKSIELYQGYKTTVTVSRNLLTLTRAQIITPASITVSGAVTKGETSITVTATTVDIRAGTWLRFEDPDEQYVLAKVTADAASGATSLTVEATVADIPDSASAFWPPEIYGLNDASITRTLNINETQNFNTGGVSLKSPATLSYEVSTPGSLVNGNPGYLTAFDAAKLKLPLWLGIKFEAPDADSSVLGPETFIARAYVSDFSTTSPADGFREGGLTFAISGNPDEVLYSAIS